MTYLEYYPKQMSIFTAARPTESTWPVMLPQANKHTPPEEPEQLFPVRALRNNYPKGNSEEIATVWL